MTAILPPFVLTFDNGDHCLLALRLSTENEQNAALLEITRMIRKRERENAAEKDVTITPKPDHQEPQP